MNPIFYSEGAGAKGLPPLSPALPIPAEPASASLRTISLDDSELCLAIIQNAPGAVHPQEFADIRIELFCGVEWQTRGTPS